MSKTGLWFYFYEMLLAVVVSVVLPTVAHAIEPVRLTTVNMDKQEIHRICQHFDIMCAADAKLWQLPKQPNQTRQLRPNHYYLIDSTPQLVELQIQDHKAITSGQPTDKNNLLGRWQFANYIHRSWVDSWADGSDVAESDSHQLFINPKLYPLNQTEMAIALVSQTDMSFDGGLASEQAVDFLQLLPKGKYELVLANVPFDGHYRYNACFTEQEKAQSLHCQEEGWQTVNVSMTDIKKPLYEWTFDYQNKLWSAHTAEDKSIIEAHQIQVMPFSDTKTIF